MGIPSKKKIKKEQKFMARADSAAAAPQRQN
jgi:hypothetical protein